MMVLSAPILVLLAGSAAVIEGDLDRLQGRWKVVLLKVGGQEGQDQPSSPKVLVIDRDRARFEVPGVPERGSLKVELKEKTSPRQINLVGEDEQKYFGVYELDGNRLKLRYHKADRPEALDARDKSEPPFDVYFEFEKQKD